MQMRDPSNPFTILENQISDIKKIVLEIKNTPREDYSIKYYTIKEVEDLIKKSDQTIKNYGKKGWIRIEGSGPRDKRINHYQIFNKDNSLKQFPPNRNAK